MIIGNNFEILYHISQENIHETTFEETLELFLDALPTTRSKSTPNLEGEKIKIQNQSFEIKKPLLDHLQ